MQAIEAIHAKQLNDLGNGEYTVNVPGGVLSCNPPDGHFTVRPVGTDGAYERCKIVGGSLVFAPKYDGPLVAYLVPYAADIPNA